MTIFFVLGLTSLSTHFRTVPACNRGTITTLYCCLTEISHRPVTLFWQRVIQFELYPLYVEHLTRELQQPIRNVWFDSTGNRTRASQTRIERSTTRLSCWLDDERDDFNFSSLFL